MITCNKRQNGTISLKNDIFFSDMDAWTKWAEQVEKAWMRKPRKEEAFWIGQAFCIETKPEFGRMLKKLL